MDEMIEMEGFSPQSPDNVVIIDDSVDEAVGFKEYSITSYGADFDVEGLVRRLDKNDIEIPEFQRKFVWTQERASRFIEALLMGLPVPGIFLYREDDSGKLQVIDGQQRLRTLQTFYSGKGTFGNRGEQIFALQDLKTKFNGQTYRDLEDKYRRKLDNSIIHATVIRQEIPDDAGSSKYFVFERLNTESSPLSTQEIRAAIYQGPFNNLISALNRDQSWRILYGGMPDPDRRKRDEELILRFLALYFVGSDKYKSPMKSFLNEYMSCNRCLEKQDKEKIQNAFLPTVETILAKIGKDAFKPRSLINAAVTDAIMVGVARRLENGDISKTLRQQYDGLIENASFSSSVSKGTSQAQNVRSRIELATKAFADSE